jgi:hypothetical protein
MSPLANEVKWPVGKKAKPTLSIVRGKPKPTPNKLKEEGRSLLIYLFRRKMDKKK